MLRPLILAAGRGSRLGPRTDFMPKSLISVAGAPLISWVLQTVAEVTTPPPVIVVGYRADQLQSFIEIPGTTFVYADWHEPPAASIMAAFRIMAEEDEFLCVNSDVLLTSASLKALLDDHGTAAGTDQLLFARSQVPRSQSWSFSFDGPIIRGLSLNQCVTTHEVVAAIFQRRSLAIASRVIHELTPYSRLPYSGWLPVLSALLYKGISMKGVFVDSPFVNINTPEDLIIAESFVSNLLH